MAGGTRVGMKKFSIGKRKRNNDHKLAIKDGEGSSKMMKIRLKKGDKVNISQILFTKERDFLITNNGQQLPYDHLNGKVIVLHFVPLAPWCENLRRDVDSLVDIYNAIHPNAAAFEVVFIGFKVPKRQRSDKELTKSHQDYFQEKFSIMPWTAIPFSHTTISLNYWQRILGHPMYQSGHFAVSSTFSLVIDPAGVVLQLGADDIFLLFGAEAYPFSDKRVSHLELKDQAALDCPSITQLLTSPGHEHLIDCHNTEVPAKDLEDKTVALYFYEDCSMPFDWFTKKLKDAYKNLSPTEKERFEVVLVYIEDSIDALGYACEDSFWNTLYGMPWLALPFKHPRCKNLRRIFEYSAVGPDPRLVIIGPRGSFVEPYGADILENFGADAYPFTRKKAVKLDVDYIKRLRLDMFLDLNNPFWSKDKLSQLKGKKIILIVEDGGWNEHPAFWHSLTNRYNLMKKKGDPFEVIHIPYEDMSSSAVPWLRCPPYPRNSGKHDFACRVFRSVFGLLAFDGDGTVVRKTRYPRIQKGNVCFPFYDGGLEKEALKDLIQGFEWYDSELVRGF